MSNAYDTTLFSKTENFFIENKFRFSPSVYLGIPGPGTETEAECRFYRDIGSDILGYSLIPENLAAIHCGMNCLAFGMLSRELVADRLKEIDDKERKGNRLIAEKQFADIIPGLIKII
jgi:purine-nucleoside phosphorylase